MGKMDKGELGRVIADDPPAKKMKKEVSSLPEKMNIGTLVDLAVSRMERMGSPDMAIYVASKLDLQKETQLI